MNFAKLKKIYLQKTENTKIWAGSHLIGLFILNLLIMILVLLRSAGYFSPFFLISINFIVFVTIVLSVAVLGLRSRQIFVLALLLWLFSGLLFIVGIKVWAERSTVYMFQALIVGVVILIIETIHNR